MVNRKTIKIEHALLFTIYYLPFTIYQYKPFTIYQLK